MKLSLKLMEQGRRDDKLYPFYIYKLDSNQASNIIFPHWHEELEMIFCLFDGTAEIDGVTISLKNSDIIIVNKEQFHLVNSNSKGICYAIVFNYDFLSFAANDFCQNNIINNLISEQLRFPNKLDTQNEFYQEVQKNIVEIIDLYYGNILGKELKIKSILYNIIFLFYNKNQFINHTTYSNSNKTQQLNYIRATIKYMEENFETTITIDDLAKNVNISTYYLIKIFKQFTATTPIDYLINLRIENAITFLKRDQTITETAHQLGFNNVNYFIKKFKERYKITPKKFAQYNYFNK